MASSRRNSDASFPPIMIQRGTPCPGPANGAANDEVDTRLLPNLTPYRSVLSSGGQSYQWTNNGPFKEPHPVHVKSEGSRLLQPCGKDPRSYFASPNMEQVNIKSRQHLAPLSPSVHHLRPPVGCGRHVTPTSPTFSDISSIRLTPRSPAAGHFGAAESPCCNGRHKTPVRSRTIPTISSGVLLSSSLSMELDEASVSPLIPSINSYSPYLTSYVHTPVDYGSPHGVAAAAVNAGHFTRKRPLSSSPLSDLVDFNSMIRTSPSSLVAYINNSQSPAGVMGHLVPPALIQAKSNETLHHQPPPLQRKSTTTTITNHITITQHAPTDLECTTSNMALLVPATAMEKCQPVEESEPLEPLVCRWLDCEQVFEEQDDMVRHIEKVHVEEQRRGNEFVCWWQGCGRNKKPFNARYKLLIHMRIHSGEKPNKCSYPGCNKAFSRLENLKIHMRSHTGERPYLCQFPGCQKSFSNSSDRSKHQRTHIEEKPYACTYPNCVKRYTDPSSLRKHARTHQQSNKKARGEDSKEELDSCLMVQGIQKNDKQSSTNATKTNGSTEKKPAPIVVHHQPPEIPLYPVTSVMTELQLPQSPYLTAVHSPSMQQANHSPLMHASPSMQTSHSPLMQPSHSPSMQVSHSPLMQHPVPSHSPMTTGTYLTAVNGQFSNPPSPMAYSPARVMQQQQYPHGGGACHLYTAGQDTIPNRPPPEYPNNGYYGMANSTFSHDQI